MDETIVCFGCVTARTDKHGKRLTRAGLRHLVRPARRTFPQMPGVAFHGWSHDRSPATLALIRYANQLAVEEYPDRPAGGVP